MTAGCGRAQRWGGPIEDIRPGDVVWFPPGEKHWHGATPTTAMTHIAIQERLDGKTVDWMEKVSDEQYGGLTADARDVRRERRPTARAFVAAPQPERASASMSSAAAAIEAAVRTWFQRVQETR